MIRHHSKIAILLIDHEVQKVDWSLISRDAGLMPDKVAVECRVKNNFKDVEKVLYADYVICTMPLGYLKTNHQSIFQPQLSGRKVTKIRSS